MQTSASSVQSCTPIASPPPGALLSFVALIAGSDVTAPMKNPSLPAEGESVLPSEKAPHLHYRLNARSWARAHGHSTKARQRRTNTRGGGQRGHRLPLNRWVEEKCQSIFVISII